MVDDVDDIVSDSEEQTEKDEADSAGGMSPSSHDPGADLSWEEVGDLPLVGNFLPNSTSYKFYELTTPRTLKPGIVAFSVASNNRQSASRIFRTGSDIEYRQVFWVADRVGEWPEYPEVDESQGPLVDFNVTPMAPTPSGIDGELLRFRLTGWYKYVLQEPAVPYASQDSGKLPDIALADDRRTVDDSFQEDLAPIEVE